MIKILKAVQFATTAHEGQYRKYYREPYINHCLRVGSLLAEAGLHEEIVVAGILHDVVEDTDVTIEQISEEFGELVASWIAQVTDVAVPSDGNRAARARINLAHLAGCSPRAASIKLADIIDNLKDIEKNDPKFAEVYFKEKLHTINVLWQGDTLLFDKAAEIINNYYANHSN